MLKNYIRNYDSIEEMMSAYLSFSGESKLAEVDADLYVNNEKIGSEVFIPKTTNVGYVEGQGLSGETIMLTYTKTVFSSHTLTYYEGNMYFTAADISRSSEIQQNCSEGKLVEPLVEYELITVSQEGSEMQVYVPVFIVDDNEFHLDIDGLSEGEVRFIDNKGKMLYPLPFAQGTDINAASFIVVNENLTPARIQVTDRKYDVDESSYYYDPWVSVVPDVTEEVVTGLIDSSGNTYTYNRLLPYDDNYGLIIHRWIKDSDGSYWYSDFRVPYKGKSLRNTIRDEIA